MNKQVQDLLKKITYIEADIEIQKQILFSIPQADRKEMERVVGIIATHKAEINTLHAKLEKISPKDHEHIMLLERAVTEFKKIASTRKFRSVQVMQVQEDLGLQLNQTTRLPCLVKACDEEGGWTIITPEGEIRQFASSEVKEIP